MSESKPAKSLFYRAVFLLLSAHLLLGISHIALLPPWEGFDETAHFSFIQQIADTGTLPTRKTARLSKEVEKYKHHAPLPYSSKPPFEKNGGYTYKRFFQSTAATIQQAKSHLHEPPEQARRYQPDITYNWQIQHPPLYYLFLAPIYRLSRAWALADQILVLRLVSYTLAWSALLITVLGSMRLYRGQVEDTALKYWLCIGTLTIPIFYPAWFPEMARIGNDSLCALLLSLIWLLALQAHLNGNSYKVSIVLGLLLGLGCLTKSFFVPLSAGIIFFLSLHQYKEATGFHKAAWVQVGLILSILLIVSGWWYLGNFRDGVPLLGSDEMAMLQNAGGLLDGLYRHFSAKAWLRGHAAVVTTMSWSGTWSLARPPYIFLFPLAVTNMVIIICYLWVLPRHKIHTLAWMPFWLVLPVFAGFSYHVLVRIALTGEGRGTGGYYLLFMVPVIGTVIALVLRRFWLKKWFRVALTTAGLYATGFSVVISWAQVSMFSGIIYKSGSNKFYQLPESFPPVLGLPEALSNLSAIAYPKIGAVCWLTGGLLLLSGLVLLWRLVYQLSKNQISPLP